MWVDLIIGTFCVASGFVSAWGLGRAKRFRLERQLGAADRALEEASSALVQLADSAGEFQVVAKQQHEGLMNGCRALEAERNDWKNRWYACALEYGQTQELLLGERESLRRQFLKKTGEQPVMNAAVDKVTAHFREKFVVEAERGLAEDQKKRGRIEGSQSVADVHSAVEKAD